MKHLLFIPSLLISMVTIAQEKPWEKNNKLFLQETMNYAPLGYVSPPFCDVGNPKKAYILSADMQPRFVIGGRSWAFPIHLTPRYKVRIFRDNLEAGDSSLPIRTPSFMPGGTIFFKTKKLLTQDRKTLPYYSISIFHHSNGQDGPEFNNNGKINVYNGNFSTNYIEPAVHFRYRNFTDPDKIDRSRCSDEIIAYQDYYIRLGYEHHWGTAKDLNPTYGNYRLNVDFTYLLAKVYCLKDGEVPSESYYRERHRINISATCIMGNRQGEMNNLNRRINFNANYNWRLPGSPNTCLFIGGGYYGSDTYNIYYQQSYWYAHAGLSFGFLVTPKMIDLLSARPKKRS